jgi:hypothetical protein
VRIHMATAAAVWVPSLLAAQADVCFPIVQQGLREHFQMLTRDVQRQDFRTAVCDWERRSASSASSNSPTLSIELPGVGNLGFADPSDRQHLSSFARNLCRDDTAAVASDQVAWLVAHTVSVALAERYNDCLKISVAGRVGGQVTHTDAEGGDAVVFHVYWTSRLDAVSATVDHVVGVNLDCDSSISHGTEIGSEGRLQTCRRTASDRDALYYVQFQGNRGGTPVTILPARRETPLAESEPTAQPRRSALERCTIEHQKAACDEELARRTSECPTLSNSARASCERQTMMMKNVIASLIMLQEVEQPAHWVGVPENARQQGIDEARERVLRATLELCRGIENAGAQAACFAANQPRMNR